MRRFAEIFDKVISEWPESIAICDNGVPAPDAEGHYFPALTIAKKAAESAFGGPASDTHECLMVWSIYGVLHRHALSAIRRNEFEIQPGLIPRQEFETAYWEDLQVEGWEALREEYHRN